MRHRRLAPVTTAALVPILLSGCSGDDAQENPPVGVVRSEQVNVLNATIVSDGESLGTLVATVLNEAPEPDALTDVAVVTEEGSVDVVLPDGSVELPTDDVVRLAVDSEVLMSGDGLREGYFLEIVYEFENAPTLRDVVPVRTTEAEFTDVDVPTQEEFDSAG